MRKTIKTDVKNIISDLAPEQLRWLSCVCNVKLSRNFDSLKEVTETDVIIEVLETVQGRIEAPTSGLAKGKFDISVEQLIDLFRVYGCLAREMKITGYTSFTSCIDLDSKYTNSEIEGMCESEFHRLGFDLEMMREDSVNWEDIQEREITTSIHINISNI